MVAGASEVVQQVHTDHLETPRALSGSAAAAVWRGVYRAFGSVETDEDPDGDLANVSLAVRFPGQSADPENALHYNRFRTYDPTAGRYISADPVGQYSLLRFARRLVPTRVQAPSSFGTIRIRHELEGSGSLNVFSYALSSSVTWVDPSGLAPFHNNTNHPVMVSANNPNGPGRIEFEVPAGGRIDAFNPGPTSDGDVDGVDFNGDGIVEPYSSVLDTYPFGDKINDTPGFPKGTGVVCEVNPHPRAGTPASEDNPGISPNAVVPRVGGTVFPDLSGILPPW